MEKINELTGLYSEKAFFEAVSKKYSNVPVIVITPIWRKDCSAPVNGVVFEEVEKLIKNTCNLQIVVI